MSSLTLWHHTPVSEWTCASPQQQQTLFNKGIQLLCKEKSSALISGDRKQYSTAKYELRSAIRKAKSNYAVTLEQQIASNYTITVEKKLKEMTNNKKSLSLTHTHTHTHTHTPDIDPDLPDKLNEFYWRFEQPPVPPYISNTLKWAINTDHITKKAHQRLFFLRQLKKFRVKHNLHHP